MAGDRPVDKLARRPQDVPASEEQRRQADDFEAALEVEGGDMLEVALSDALREVRGDDKNDPVANREASQDMILRHTVHDRPWPEAGERLSMLASEYGRYWLEELLKRAKVDLERGLAILAVRNELIRLDLDPSRYEDVDVMAIHRNLGRLQHMRNNAERSCFIQNLESA